MYRSHSNCAREKHNVFRADAVEESPTTFHANNVTECHTARTGLGLQTSRIRSCKPKKENCKHATVVASVCVENSSPWVVAIDESRRDYFIIIIITESSGIIFCFKTHNGEMMSTLPSIRQSLPTLFPLTLKRRAKSRRQAFAYETISNRLYWLSEDKTTWSISLPFHFIYRDFLTRHFCSDYE